MNETEYKLEYQRQLLLKECHALVAKIGQSAYSLKLLKLAKHALETVAGYKSNRNR